METSALAASLVSMKADARAQQFSLVALKQAHEMQQMAVDLLAQAAQAGKSPPAPGTGGMLDRSV